MKINWKNHSVCGIYCIRNVVNNKVYIGKSLNVANRIAAHRSALNRKDRKSENEHFINSWWKYGSESFDYFILEVLDKSDIDNLKERELFWMNEYKSTDRNFGYNLRQDSSSNMIVHQETREKISKAVKGERNPNYGNKWSDEKKEYMSNLKKDMYKNGHHKKLTKEQLQQNLDKKLEKWKNNPTLIDEMVRKCNLHKIKYEIHQYSKDGNLIRKWNDILELAKAHPEYKRHNIYAVCSGEKPTMYGYRWVKVLKN